MHKFFKKLGISLLSFSLLFSSQIVSPKNLTPVQAASSTRIHYLTLPDNVEAILLESNGKFGMVDSGEDNDYPTGSDSRYPFRSGIIVNNGFEDRVISYLNSVGVTQDNFEFYIGTHPHSDHIGSADEIIRAFHPKRVYIQEYKDSYISSPGNLWDNLYVYDHMIAAAQEVGATIIQNFDPSAPLYPEKVNVTGRILWDDGENQDCIRPASILATLSNPITKKTESLTVSPDASGNWNYTFENLQKYDDNKSPINYQVTLAAPNGYTISSENSFDFRCTHTPSTATELITVQWDHEAARPDSLNIEIQKKAVTVETITVPEEITEETAEEAISDDSTTDPSAEASEEPSAEIVDESSVEIPEASVLESAIAPQTETTVETVTWETVSTLTLKPNAQGVWSASAERLPQTDESGNPIIYRLNVLSNSTDYTYTTEEGSFVITAHYNGAESVPESGILDSEPADSHVNFPATDGMTTSSIPSTDQVDPENPADPNNITDGSAASAREGRFETYGLTQNTTSTPNFTLGSMQIEIKHYGGDYKVSPKPDANYFSLGVLVKANGKSAFLAGDINNYEGAETALVNELKHVDILTLAHHGYYGSNTYSYVTNLTPKIMVMPGTYSAVSNTTSPNGERGTLDTLVDMGKKKVPLYVTGWYNGLIDALVFNFDSSLSNNIPPKAFIGGALKTTPAEHLFYQNGLPTAHSGWVTSNGYTCHFDNSIYSSKNKWIKDSAGRYSYLKADGTMATGWIKVNGSSYYMNSSGYMQTGWLKDNNYWYYLDSTGAMLTGKRTVDGSQYYFASNGAMVVSAWAGGQFYGADGKWIPNYKNKNWKHNSVGWWYQRPDGSYPANKWELIDGTWYYFNAKGYMVTGWLKTGGKWYYLNANGAMQTGWLKTGGKWYYLNSSGAMQTGWLNLSGTYYYLTPGSGAMYGQGWHKIAGNYYYMNANGSMAANKWIGNYYVDNRGVWLKDYTNRPKWIKSGNRWWYRHANGSYTKNNWEKIDGKWYYFDASGWMKTGWLKTGNQWYYLNSSGAMQTGWQKVNGSWYYFNSGGAMLGQGWHKISNKWYYMYASGAMASNTRIGGYYLSASGAWIPGK